MDWSRIKTIFIIAFLILDLFLLTQFLNKHKTNQFEVKSDVSFEESLKADGIEYKSLPKDPGRDQYMSANTMIFSKDEVSGLKHQKVSITDGTAIHSQLDIKVIINEKLDFSELDNFIKENILYGNHYGFWDYDQEAGTITYFQKFNDKLLFMNRSAHLVFYVNEDNEVESYEQTMLDTIEPISHKEEEEILAAIRAVEALYRKGFLRPGSEIVETQLGYYTLVNMEATQVLTPTWHFVIEQGGARENFLVNAFEGQVIQGNVASEKKIME